MRSIRPLFVAPLVIACASYSSAAPVPMPRPPPPAAPPATSSIGPIVKEHNLDLGNRSMGMRITAPAELVGVAGQTVALVVWFYDADGQPIRSALEGWGDATNQLRVVSRDVSPATAREHVDFTFKVPYCAFPRRSGGRYAVEARAVLLERVGKGRLVLARQSTTFFVE